MFPDDTPEFRAWLDSKLAPADANGCRVWLGYRTKGGYGRWSRGSRQRRRDFSVHRVVCVLTHGPFTLEKPFACHTCNNPPCGTDEHVYPDDAAGNARYMAECKRAASGDRNAARLYPERLSRGDAHWTRLHPERLARGDCGGTHLHPETQQGESNGRAKLTTADVLNIRASYGRQGRGGETQVQLAARFGVSQYTISQIVLGKKWRHVA